MISADSYYTQKRMTQEQDEEQQERIFEIMQSELDLLGYPRWAVNRLYDYLWEQVTAFRIGYDPFKGGHPDEFIRHRHESGDIGEILLQQLADDYC